MRNNILATLEDVWKATWDSVHLQSPALIGLHRSGAPHGCHCIPSIPIPLSHCRSTIRRLWTRPAVRAAICWQRLWTRWWRWRGGLGYVWSGFLLLWWSDEEVEVEEEEEAPRVFGTLRAQSITVAVDFTLRTAQVRYL